MRTPPASVMFATSLLYLLAFCWFCFGWLVLFNWIPSIPAGSFRWIMGILSIGCSIVLTLITFFMKRQNRLAYLTVISLLMVIILVSFLDNLGPADFILIVFDLTALGLLIKDRAWYMHLTP